MNLLIRHVDGHVMILGTLHKNVNYILTVIKKKRFSREKTLVYDTIKIVKKPKNLIIGESRVI